MKGLREYITEQLTPRQSRFDRFNYLEDESFLLEGIKLDYENRTVKLDDSSNGIDFINKPLEYKYKGMNVISIFKRTALNSPIYGKDPDGNPFIYALKGKRGWKLDMSITDVKKYLKKFIDNCKSIKKEYDTCIMIPSSSSVNELFMKELKKNIKCKNYIKKFFYKMSIDDIIMGGIDHEKISKSDNSKLIEKEISKCLNKMKGEYFEAKLMRKDLLQYIKYVTYDENEDDDTIREKIDGKDVLILDDIISSGESVSQAVDALKSGFSPKSITVITLLSKKFN